MTVLYFKMPRCQYLELYQTLITYSKLSYLKYKNLGDITKKHEKIEKGFNIKFND
jgi:hypothetical protein